MIASGESGKGCKGVPAFPMWAEPSSKYRELFNKVAAEKGLPFQYKKDDPQGRPNVPEPELDEIDRTDSKAWVKYAALPNHQWRFANDICQVRRTIEERRIKMNKAGMDVFPILSSATYTRGFFKTRLNKAEQAWYKNVIDVLYEETQQIYSLQAAPQAEQTLSWMREHADPASRMHYERRRTSEVVEGEVKEFKDAGQYASSVPWFPEGPAFSNMWPADFTKEELGYINNDKHYDKNDPIRKPYTRVYRLASPEALSNGEYVAPGHLGKDEILWLRGGLDGRKYVVVNPVWDKEMRPHFLNMADVLEKNADIETDGQKLHPQFRDYTLAMAKALRSGDLEGMLREDLKQSEGNLFMTFYPHEGYWSDNLKYPFMFEVGIRDVALLEGAKKLAGTFEWMGRQVEEGAKQAGLTDYASPHIDFGNVQRDAVIFWPLRTGAFMRAYVRDPGGHDYPKVEVKGIDNHRVVVLLDSLETWQRLIRGVAGKIFSDKIADTTSFDGLASGALLHEVGHGAQIPQNRAVKGGKPFGEAFGNRWGALVEPWADVGAVLTNYEALRRGDIDEKTAKDGIYSSILYCFVRLRPREKALSEGYITEGPHITGSSVFIGWLYKQGAIKEVGKSGRMVFVDAQIEPATKALFGKLTAFAATGDVDGYNRFMKETVEYVPATLEEKWLEMKSKLPSYVLINRGGLVMPR